MRHNHHKRKSRKSEFPLFPIWIIYSQLNVVLNHKKKMIDVTRNLSILRNGWEVWYVKTWNWFSNNNFSFFVFANKFFWKLISQTNAIDFILWLDYFITTPDSMEFMMMSISIYSNWTFSWFIARWPFQWKTIFHLNASIASTNKSIAWPFNMQN